MYVNWKEYIDNPNEVPPLTAEMLGKDAQIIEEILESERTPMTERTALSQQPQIQPNRAL